MMIRALLLPLAAALAFSGCAPLSPPAGPGTVTGAVSAADPRAEQAGEEMLARGGNATDAAIAVMLALTVVEPQSSGIGGGGFLVRGTADGEVATLDGRETAPAGATPDWFLGPDGALPPFMESVRSGLSVGVPGNIALAAKAHDAYGSLPWAVLFEPAIRLAEEGFQVNPRLHAVIGRSADTLAVSETGRRLFLTEAGEPVPVGTLVINPELADTFRRIARGGPDAFYRASLAEEIAESVAAATPREGAMALADVTGYSAKEREPVCAFYRAHRVCTMGPPTSGGIAVLQILGLVERFDLAALGLDNPVTWHLFVEAQRLAYADRELYLADSDFVAVPVEGLIDPDYLARRSALLTPGTAMAEVEAGTPPGAVLPRGDGDEPADRGTSHFAVADRTGTMVSYTSTIEGPFGSGLMAGGFFLNNELTDFSRSPVVDGRTVANRVEGGKRPRSSMAPTIVYDPAGLPLLAVGAAGGGTIPVQTARTIIGVIDFGLPADKALGLPFIMAFGDRLLIEEDTWLADHANRMRVFGYGEVLLRSAPVKGNAVIRTPVGWIAARDPRLEGQLELP
jgi:gamma-glutamyltranspeptidase/glutathione hydrolase